MKKFAVILSELLLFSVLGVPAFAQTITIKINPDDVPLAVPPGVPVGKVLGFIVGAAVTFGIIAALLFIVLGAFQWITSGGDKTKVESARNHIVAAIVGLVIIVLSLVIINFVLQLLGVNLGEGLPIPTIPRK